MRRWLDLTGATIYDVGGASRAAAVLHEEILRRTGIALPVASAKAPAVCSPRSPAIEVAAVRGGPESVHLACDSCSGHVTCVGGGPRGALYAVGRLLRALHWGPGVARVPATLAYEGEPRQRLRGHQLGYRPRNNTCDAWLPEQFDRYIRELALFGANSIEIVPPRTDDIADAATQPVMQVEALPMMAKIADIISSYDLDVWIWYPNMFSSTADKAVLRVEMAERAEVFAALSRIDHVFIPGGDPGELAVDDLFDWAQTVSGLLWRYHPAARVWLSPQVFLPGRDWMKRFYERLELEPDWLGGVVFAPWVPHDLPTLRQRVPSRYPIRNYSDYSHSMMCQYPVPEWDIAFAITQGREPINPRPAAFKHIHNRYSDYTIGSLMYSEGVHDDVNKFVWSDQDWDPSTSVVETLTDYARLFIDPDHAEDLADGFLSIESNWIGPLADNLQVDSTHQQWQELSQQLTKLGRHRNYRFNMGLLRASCDLLLLRRLKAETQQEYRAVQGLTASLDNGGDLITALDAAEHELLKAERERVLPELRQRCDQLSDLLFEQIGLQLTTSRHLASSWVRGAFIDGIDNPLNSRHWWIARIADARRVPRAQTARRIIKRALSRAKPEGGIYLHFGSPTSWDHVETSAEWQDDPGFLRTPYIGFALSGIKYYHLPGDARAQMLPMPHAWLAAACFNYSTPLVVRIDGLDPDCNYVLRVTYFDSRNNPSVKLSVGSRLVHDYVTIRGAADDDSPPPPQARSYMPTQEYSLPQGSVDSEGVLRLRWESAPGVRIASVAELWILPTSTEVS